MAGLVARTHLGFSTHIASSPLPSCTEAFHSSNHPQLVLKLAPLCVRSALENEEHCTRFIRARRLLVRMQATPSSSATQTSILCKSCDGNGAVSCTQCDGSGVNTQDHFAGRFKTGGTCWLCRGKRHMLCGNCNGAGFMGGFMNTQDD